MKNTKEKIKKYLEEILDDTAEIIPESIINFWVENYGLTVNKTITDENNKKWNIDRILTVDSDEEVDQNSISWRNNSDFADLDYSLPYLESILSNWEENDTLIPIMGIESNNYANYDLLVINISNNNIPKISIWVHDENWNSDEPYLIDISKNCDEFINKWNDSN